MRPRRRLPLGSRLDRYVAARFAGSYAAALGLILGLFVVLELAGNVDRWFEPWEDGSAVPGIVLLRYCVVNLPYTLLRTAPFVTLVAGMFTVNRLLRKNEVAAVLSAGISAHRLLLPVYLGGAMAAGAMFFLREAVGHGLADRRDELRDVLEEHRTERVLESVVVRDLSGSIVVLERFWPEPAGGGPPTVEGLTVRLRREGRYLRVDAPRAQWRDGALVLEGGRRTRLDDEEAAVEDVEVLEGFEISPEIALTYARAHAEPLELSFSEIQELIRREPDHPAWLTLWHYHLTFPLANLVLLLVGMPLMFTYERGGGSERMALGGLLCVFYFGVDFVLRSLGLAGGLSPVLASWVPVLLFGSLGVVLTEGIRS